MQDATYIKKHTPDDPMQSYSRLREDAIALLQKLSATTWTDYNLHDPGITILEQLCYALTELEYKAGFEVKDLLTDKESRTIPYRKLGLYLPHEIFPSRPITVNDYRKVLFDAFPDVYNVWVYPKKDDNEPLLGLYSIVAGVDGAREMGIDQRNAVCENIRNVFCRHRNIAEDVCSVEVLQTEEVKVFAEIEISGKYLPEDVLAEVFFRLSCYLLEEIKTYSLRDLQDKGMSLEEIFTGPLLKNGFVLDAELLPKQKRISVKNVFQNIAGSAGVQSIQQIWMEHDGQHVSNSISFEDDATGPHLFVPRNDAEQTIRLTKKGRTIRANMAEVRNKYFQLRAKYRNAYKQEVDFEVLIPPISGDHKDVGTYHSIQHQFPSVYGIGKEGVGASTLLTDNSADGTVLRRAQSKQLKAYLMLFEQVMANFLAQLQALPELFARDTNAESTYFSQRMKSVPNVGGLYTCLDDQIERTLSTLVEQHDNAFDRRNRVLDYLLGLYGEQFSQSALSQFNYYFRPDELQRQKIKNKVRFLTRLQKLSRNKAKAFSYIDQAWNTGNISGLEERVSILLDIKYTKDKSCVSVFGYRGLDLISEQDHDGDCNTCSMCHNERSITDQVYVEQHFRFVAFPDVDQDGEEPNHTDLFQTILPLANNKISDRFLRSAVNSAGYKIGQMPGNEQFTLAHYFRKEAKWKEIGTFGTYDKAVQAARHLRQLIIDLNRDSEGLHLIEHILLRSKAYEHHSIVSIDGTEGPNAFCGFFAVKKTERESLFIEIQNRLCQHYSYTIIKEADNFCIVFDIHPLQTLRCKNSYETYSDAQQAIDDFVYFYRHKVSEKETYSLVHINNFFSFGVTMLFPAWTARFNNKHFRALAEDTVRYCAPAHIKCNILWLSPKAIVQFETLYAEWLEVKQKSLPDSTSLDSVSEELVKFLIKHTYGL